MKSTKIFLNGRSQAIRLPKECRFENDEVYLKKIGEMVIIMPKKDMWKDFFTGVNQFSDDFLEERNQPSTQKRNTL